MVVWDCSATSTNSFCMHIARLLVWERGYSAFAHAQRKFPPVYIKSCLHYKPWPGLGQTKVNVEHLHHYTGFFLDWLTLALNFVIKFCVFLCVVTLSAGWPLISHFGHTLP